MKKGNNQIGSEFKTKKQKSGNHKFSRALIGGAFIVAGCGCFAYPNLKEWNTQREVEQIIDSFDETYSQGLDDSSSGTANSAEDIKQTCTPGPTKTEGNKKDSETLESMSSDSNEDNKKTKNDSNVTESESSITEDSKITSYAGTRPYQNLYDAMSKYNKDLAKNGQSIVDAWSYEQQPIDLGSLNIDSDNPIIGYIEIPDMKIRLPLMLGASTPNLKKGAAVLSQTSMPIGGDNTNCVIAGHRGWEGSAYFQYIENMKKGSKVYITNPWETLVYECTSTKVIYPDDVNSILIQPGKDMVTLFSCHPYVLGGGPYRYLVFCERVDTQERKEVDGILNPKTNEPEEDITITDTPETSETTDDTEANNNQTTKDETEQVVATVTPSESEHVPTDEEVNNYRTVAGIDLLALEQTLRYMLPIIVIAISLLVILFRNNKWHKKPKKSNKKKNKNAKRRK